MKKNLAFLLCFFFLTSLSIFFYSRNSGSIQPVKTPSSPLNKLINTAKHTNSNVLVIMKNGKLIGEWHFNSKKQTIETMSITKSIVSLAIGFLLDEKKIKSLDVPVYKWFPEWDKPLKKDITLRMLLNHTSGIHANKTTKQLYKSSNFVKYALRAEQTTKPGSQFFYNNRATNLLPEIVKKASNQTIDVYLDEKLFKPLGIKEFSWMSDPSGNRIGMSGLSLHAVDLAKIGQFMLNKGRWKGKQLLKESWIVQMTKAGQKYNPMSGLLWWRRPTVNLTFTDSVFKTYKEKGISQDTLQKIKFLKGKSIKLSQINQILSKHLSSNEIQNIKKELWSKLGSTDYYWSAEASEKGTYRFSARGWLGQYLIVIPDSQLVVVRQITYKRVSNLYQGDFVKAEQENTGFTSIYQLVEKLASSQ